MKNKNPSIKEIRDATSKYASTTVWYARTIARPISFFLTKPFLRFDPNTIGFMMILVGLASLPFFFLGGYWNIIIGALILQGYFMLDNIDGNVARVTKKTSVRGKYLDYVPNISVNQLVLIALGFGIFRTSGNISYFLLGVSAGFFYLAKEPARLFKYSLMYHLNIKTKPSTNKKNISKIQKINQYTGMIFDFPGMMNLILIFGIFNLSHLLIILYGIYFPIYFVARATYEFYVWKNYDLMKK
jgi:phosphatidylglycerophosphate synthase